MLPPHASVASRPSRPRHRLTRLISRPAPKPHLSPTSSRTRHPQLARARPPDPGRPRSRPRPRSTPDPVERHETPDPVRSDAVDPRFHYVRRPTSGALRPAPYVQRPAPGSRPPRHPLRATHPPEPECQPNERRTRTQTERNPLIRGKPFLTASNTPADYAELPTARPRPERIEGVSRSLPFSDLLALTSSHMFFSVMN
jgi:hypothetical protein